MLTRLALIVGVLLWACEIPGHAQEGGPFGVVSGTSAVRGDAVKGGIDASHFVILGHYSSDVSTEFIPPVERVFTVGATTGIQLNTFVEMSTTDSLDVAYGVRVGGVFLPLGVFTFEDLTGGFVWRVSVFFETVPPLPGTYGFVTAARSVTTGEVQVASPPVFQFEIVPAD